MKKLFVLFFMFNVFIATTYCYCSTENDSIVLYKEIKDLPNHPEVLLIDVRDQEEIEESGKIPTSINIPLNTLKETLTSSAEKETFLKKYGRKFPGVDDIIIFTCRGGKRAQDAMELACSLGFKKAKFYKGSWLDWAAKEGIQP